MYKLTACYMVKYVCILKIFLLFDVASVRVVTQKRLWRLWGCPSLHLLVKLICGCASGLADCSGGSPVHNKSLCPGSTLQLTSCGTLDLLSKIFEGVYFVDWEKSFECIPWGILQGCLAHCYGPLSRDVYRYPMP